MNNNPIQDITIQEVHAHCPNASYIDGALLLIDRYENDVLTTGRRLNCFLIALCTSGTGTYIIDTKEHTVSKNDILIVNEGQVLTDYRLSPGSEGIAFMVESDFIQEIIKGVQNITQLFMFFRSNPVYSLGDEESKTFAYYFNLIKRKADDQRHLFRKELVATLMRAMLFDLGNEIWKERTPEGKQYRTERVFTMFIKLVEAHFRHKRRVGWYAERMCVSPKYLSESVRVASHRTPNEWINHYVMVELKVQLKNTMKSIKEIAQDMNFPSQSFLGKFFKQHAGMSPLKYRKS